MDIRAIVHSVLAANDQYFAQHKLYLGETGVQILPPPMIAYEGFNATTDPSPQQKSRSRWFYSTTIPRTVLERALAVAGLTMDVALDNTAPGSTCHWAIQEAGGSTYPIRVNQRVTWELKNPEIVFRRLKPQETGAPAWLS